MPHKIITASLFVSATLLGALSLTSCGGGSTNSATPAAPGSTPASSAPSPKTGFEADLEFVRKGQYTYIWVFSRKDDKPLDKDDSAYLRKNAPQVVDWVTTDQNKRVIAGTNFDLAQGNLELLKKRFVVEDYTGR
jgi:hypothetical protein